MTLAAKQVVQSYYQTPIQRAYFQGCSGGGREAMMEVSRYPYDYNGVIAGSPAMNFGGIMSQQVWASQVFASAPTLPIKLPAVNAAAIQACDALDGVQDGVIDNPRRCSFDPIVMRCKLLDTTSCLNDAEIAAVRKLYAGPRLSSGETVLPGFSPGSESNWFESFLIGYAGGGPEYYKWMVYNNPLWTSLAFNLDTDVPVSRARVEPIGNSDNPDIRAFINAGGKLIMYHGWADEIVPSESSVRFYEAATALSGPSLSSSVRLFMIPGAHHCEAGFDMMPYLEAWSEQGQAPDRVINTTQVNSNTTTRALCPWPQTAMYNGSGSTSDASSFTCRTPS
jgi:feruloyl esterase